VANLTLLRFDGSRPETSRRDRRIGETAPLIGSSSSPELADPTSTPALARIFIVEDNPGVRNVLSLVLMREGYEVLTALQGAAALERVARWRPDLILLDMMMPVMDGPGFVRAYRATPGPHVPIVAVTGAPHMAADLGVDFVLRKPVNVDELLQVVERYSRGTTVKDD
jgi:CheY-like chemotaxis protein